MQRIAPQGSVAPGGRLPKCCGACASEGDGIARSQNAAMMYTDR